jgi:hypothetical protein
MKGPEPSASAFSFVDSKLVDQVGDSAGRRVQIRCGYFCIRKPKLSITHILWVQGGDDEVDSASS